MLSCRGGLRSARSAYRRTFFSWFEESEGVWLEHSMGYWDYAIHLIDNYLRVVDPVDEELRAARAKLVDRLLG